MDLSQVSEPAGIVVLCLQARDERRGIRNGRISTGLPVALQRFRNSGFAIGWRSSASNKAKPSSWRLWLRKDGRAPLRPHASPQRGAALLRWSAVIASSSSWVRSLTCSPSSTEAGRSCNPSPGVHALFDAVHQDSDDFCPAERARWRPQGEAVKWRKPGASSIIGESSSRACPKATPVKV